MSLIPFKPEGEFKRWICCGAECRQEVKSHQGKTPHFKIQSPSPVSASCSRLSSCLFFFFQCYITFSVCGVFPPPYTLYHNSVLVPLYMLRYTWRLQLGFKMLYRLCTWCTFFHPTIASPFLTFLWLETTAIINSGSWIQGCHSLVFSHSLYLLHQMSHSLKRWHREGVTWKVDFCNLKPAKFSVPRVSPSWSCRWVWIWNISVILQFLWSSTTGSNINRANRIWHMWSSRNMTKNNVYIKSII